MADLRIFKYFLPSKEYWDEQKAKALEALPTKEYVLQQQKERAVGENDYNTECKVDFAIDEIQNNKTTEKFIDDSKHSEQDNENIDDDSADAELNENGSDNEFYEAFEGDNDEDEDDENGSDNDSCDSEENDNDNDEEEEGNEEGKVGKIEDLHAGSVEKVIGASREGVQTNSQKGHFVRGRKDARFSTEKSQILEGAHAKLKTIDTGHTKSLNNTTALRKLCRICEDHEDHPSSESDPFSNHTRGVVCQNSSGGYIMRSLVRKPKKRKCKICEDVEVFSPKSKSEPFIKRLAGIAAFKIWTGGPDGKKEKKQQRPAELHSTQNESLSNKKQQDMGKNKNAKKGSFTKSNKKSTEKVRMKTSIKTKGKKKSRRLCDDAEGLSRLSKYELSGSHTQNISAMNNSGQIRIKSLANGKDKKTSSRICDDDKDLGRLSKSESLNNQAQCVLTKKNPGRCGMKSLTKDTSKKRFCRITDNSCDSPPLSESYSVTNQTRGVVVKKKSCRICDKAKARSSVDVRDSKSLINPSQEWLAKKGPGRYRMKSLRDKKNVCRLCEDAEVFNDLCDSDPFNNETQSMLVKT